MILNFKTLFIVLMLLIVIILEILLVVVVQGVYTNPEVGLIPKVLLWIYPIIFPIFCLVVLYVKVKEGEIRDIW